MAPELMHHFDLYLEPRDESSLDPKALLDVLSRSPHLRATTDDPSRLVYRNEDTSVHFVCLLDRALLRSSRGHGESPLDDDDEDEAVTGWRDVHPDEDDLDDEMDDDFEDDGAEADGASGQGGEEEGDEDEEEEFAPIETPALTFSLPLFRPTFFLKEMWDLLSSVRQATGLLLLDPQEGGAGHGEPGDWSEEEIEHSWAQTHRRAISNLKDTKALQYWSPEKCRDFFAYGLARGPLTERLEAQGIDIPRLQPATHDRKTKSLCIWNLEQPSVLPRADLVLFQQRREKRGLFGRRTVREEVIVPGEELWRLLTPAAEYRAEPTPMLIVPDLDSLPPSVATALDEVAGEPADHARRTELVGVIDLELDSAASDAGKVAEGGQGGEEKTEE